MKGVVVDVAASFAVESCWFHLRSEHHASTDHRRKSRRKRHELELIDVVPEVDRRRHYCPQEDCCATTDGSDLHRIDDDVDVVVDAAAGVVVVTSHAMVAAALDSCCCLSFREKSPRLACWCALPSPTSCLDCVVERLDRGSFLEYCWY